ncbi:MAG TPA: nicotinate phosphoribosyltransferase [Aridibacter sp.]|nr:nicotinate phosphoribosyltransferase [Aridibacter sp.]
MIDLTATYTDHYEIAMSQAYFGQGRTDERAVFDYFFRESPFGGGYTVFAGLDVLLDALQSLRFDEKDIKFLREQGLAADFLGYLEKFRFSGDLFSSREGDVVFPVEPILRVEGNIIEAQLIETLLLNILNFHSLVATKASRIRQVAGDDAVLIDFGLRRSHGPGGYYASRAAVIGGFDSTSNVRAGRDYGIPVSGTMAHSFVQSFADELSSFRVFAREHPDDCVLLVDTYDTLRSGVPNAIRVGQEMQERGQRLSGIRLDSGDLAYLSKAARRMLDEAGLSYVSIAASNQLDEHVIRSLREQGAAIDVYGVGTSLVTGSPDAALDGVYKLAFADGKPRIKLSESTEKISVPFAKQVFRVLDEEGNFWGADAIALDDESDIEKMHHPSDPLKSISIEGLRHMPLLHKVMENGGRVNGPQSLSSIREYSRERLAMLPDEFKRFENPHIYKVGLSERLKRERDQLIKEQREKWKH